MRLPEGFLKNRKIAAALLALLVVLLFPVQKKSEVTYVGRTGDAGTLLKERTAPWWFPEAFLKKRVPLESAPLSDAKELAEKAYEDRDIEKLKVIQENYPAASELAAALQQEEPQSREQGASKEEESRSPQPNRSTPAGGTLEAKIPAAIPGFKFITETRSLLSWSGIFKPQKDLNVDVLEVTIEMIGKREAESEVARLRQAYGRNCFEVSVKGLRAYYAVVNPREARLFFSDGDFFYEYRLTLKGGAQEYKEVLKKIAEESYL